MRKFMIVCLAAAVPAFPAQADIKSTLAREAAEAVVAKFGARVASKGLPALAARIETCAVKYGPDAYKAVRRVGPQAFELAEAAGVNGAKACRVMAVHGQAGASHIVKRPKAMAAFLKYGEDAAVALVKHPGIAEKVVERGGGSAVKAMLAVNPQGGRRIAMMLEGQLAGSAAHHPALLEVIAKHGQVACDFVWANKAVLAGSAAMVAFVANPAPFLEGTASLAKVAGDTTVGVAKVAGENVVAPVVGGVFTAVHWLIGGVIAVAVGAVALMWKHGMPSPDRIRATGDALRGK